MLSQANVDNSQSQETRNKPRHDRAVFVAPLADIYENDNEFVALVELPSVGAKDLQVRLDKDVLTIMAGSEESEFRYRRSFVVPSDVDAEKVTAEMKDGVLTLHISKLVSHRPRTIVVKSSE